MTGEPLDWSEGGPRSQRFGDVYFSAVDGLAESRAVFLAGCGLPDRWAERPRFTVAELGFGSGLNILALLELWGRSRAPGARLRVFSVEAFPLDREDAARALAAWPELAELAGALLARWPARTGLHRIDFPQAGAVLDLAIAEAGPALAGWEGRADAWFLDGFAPARNPEMWRPELMELVAARSAPGARAATFSVAGAVRRGLEAVGFAVDKRPGFGRKRERLEARWPGEPAPAPPPRVAVVGAGIAGASLVRALRAEGCAPVLYEAEGAGAGASGNPAALVTPRLDAGLGAAARLHAQTFDRAVRLYAETAPEAVLARGVAQLERSVRDRTRFASLAAWDGFAAGALQPLTPDAVAGLLDEPPGAGGLWLRDALAIDPAALLRRWLDGVETVPARVARLIRTGGGWRLEAADGAGLGEADAVCLAAGAAAARLAPTVELRIVRGQVSWADRAAAGPPAAWGGYAVPVGAGLLFGATHDRRDEGLDVRAGDHARNLASLADGRPRLAAALAGAALHGRASLRAATPDHLPLAGSIGPGLLVLGGLGGRGFSLAPLLAEQIAAELVGAPKPLPRDLAAAVAPTRFRTD